MLARRELRMAMILQDCSIDENAKHSYLGVKALRLSRPVRTLVSYRHADGAGCLLCRSLGCDDHAGDVARTDLNQLWAAPSDLESRDLFYGVGGPDLAPDPTDRYELIEVDKSGYSPGYAVRDREGTRWSVKLGIEAQPELVATRVLWAIGYHQPANYLLTNWQFVDKETTGTAPRAFSS